MLEAEIRRTKIDARIEAVDQNELTTWRWRSASESMKDFAISVCGEEINWALVEDKIGELVLEARKAEEKEKYIQERLEWDREAERLRQGQRTARQPVAKRASRAGCYTCGEFGHVARDCPKRVNKATFNYLYAKKFSLERDSGEVDETAGKEEAEMNVKRLRTEFPDVLCSEDKPIVYSGVEKCRIKTRPGERIVKKGQIVAQAHRKEAEKYFEDLERRGIIRRSRSEWRYEIRVIAKPNGGLRVVSNFIALNGLTEKDPYELANIRDVIRATQGSNWFTCIDLKEGFYHIEIEEEDKHKTAFEFNGKVFEWNSMVMGFKNSPQILQRVMNKILEGLRGNGVEVYMDDIVVHAPDVYRHDMLLREVFGRLSQYKMRVNVEKIQFREREIKLLGVIINGREQTPSEIKKNEALEYPRPTNTQELRRFLGLAGWFRQFIKDYALHTEKLTDGLRDRNKGFRWTDEMESEFKNMKTILKDLKKLALPDYEKAFMLRTDASNSGLGAVLMQQGENDKWVPIQWASKKLTPTEKRYGISEKEMYAVFWGIKKFEYELRGRRFLLVTDHKALEQIREKPYFANNRINRWIEGIQEFDFEVRYNKGPELVVPDALSRLHEGREAKEAKSKEIGERVKRGKWNKHVESIDGKEYWMFDDGRTAEIPEVGDRKRLIVEAHENLKHRGAEALYYELKGRYYWPGIKETIRNVVKSCETCQINNRKKKGGCEFVVTSRPLEKVAVDVMEVKDEERYILVAVDYFTRKLWARPLRNKTSSGILETVERWLDQDMKVEELISDNGREFCNSDFREMCVRRGIRHTKVSVESHQSNGRVERAIGTIREALIKNREGTLAQRVDGIVETYNRTYHAGIRCTPLEAWKDEFGDVAIQNSCVSKYGERFRKGYREQFSVGDKVRIAPSGRSKCSPKEAKGRFTGLGEVVERFEGDSYLVRKEDGRFAKKRHHDLKAITMP